MVSHLLESPKIDGRGKNKSEEARKHISEVQRERWKKLREDPVAYDIMRKKMGKGISSALRQMKENEPEHYAERNKQTGVAIKKWWKDIKENDPVRYKKILAQRKDSAKKMWAGRKNKKD